CQQEDVEEAYQLLTGALATLRQVRDRRNVARILKETGILKRQQGQLEDALQALISAGIGLALMKLPDTLVVEHMLEQVRIQLGEDAFIAATRQTLQEPRELAYGLDQAEWNAAIRKLTKLTTRTLTK